MRRLPSRGPKSAKWPRRYFVVFVAEIAFLADVLIFGNSVIVLSVLLPSFYSAFKGSYTSTQIGAQ